MTKRLVTPAIALALALALSFIGSGRPNGGSKPRVSGGTLTVLTGFGGNGYSEPGPLIEVSPGTFAGMAIDGATAFLLTSQGAVTKIFTFPQSSYPVPQIVQAVNGRIYGAEFTALGAQAFDYSFNQAGALKMYPQALSVAPILSVRLPGGNLYGTE